MRPQYRDETLEKNPVNSGLVNFATGATGAALTAILGLPSLAAKGLGYLGTALAPHLPGTAAFLGTAAGTTTAAANAAQFAFPVVNAVNGYYDQKKSNDRERAIQENGGKPIIYDSTGSTFDKVRRGVGAGINWIGGNDPYYLVDNLSAIYK